MKNGLSLVAAIVIGAMTVGAAEAGIVSVTTGMAVRGDRATNLLANGSFENRRPGDPPITQPVYWSGADMVHTDNTLVALVYPIPNWSVTSGRGGYGIWGDSVNLNTDPCADGFACVYFGNWITQASSFPTFNGDGTVSFGFAPTFTNQDPDNQTPTTLSQTLNGLVMNATYLLDFWTSGEHYAAAFPDPGVFRVKVGTADSIYLTTPSVNSVFNANSVRYQIEFTADNATETLSFTNWGHIFRTDPAPTSTELILDDVIVNRVPEPGTLVLLATGLMCLAASRCRLAKPRCALVRVRGAMNRANRAFEEFVPAMLVACTLVSAGAVASPITLPGGPLYAEFLTKEQYSPTNGINIAGNPAGVGTGLEGNWGIVQVTALSVGTVVTPTGWEIKGPGPTFFSDGQNGGEQILGIFYGVVNNAGGPPFTSMGGVLDLYFWRSNNQNLSTPFLAADLSNRGKGGGQPMGGAPSQYLGFTCSPNNLLGCTFLARFDLAPGADTSSAANTNTIFTMALGSPSEAYLSVDPTTLGAWTGQLDSDFFTLNPIQQPCGPAIACKHPNDVRLDATLTQIGAHAWDVKDTDIMGLGKNGVFRGFVAEPNTLALVALGLVVASAVGVRGRANAQRDPERESP